MKRLILLLAATLTLALPPARAAEWGKDYVELGQAQKTDVKKGQVEVLEFFWYRCPHCYELEPELNAWARKLPKDVVLKKMPGVLQPAWMPLARAFYALEAVGMLEKLHGEVFSAIHAQGNDLSQPERFFDWAATKGVDRKQLAEAYNSFAVNTRALRAQQQTAAYKLNGVPAMFRTLDELIAQERKKGSK